MTHVRIHASEIEFTNPEIFSKSSGKLIAQFVARLLGLPEIKSLKIIPKTGSARIGFETSPETRNDFLVRLQGNLEASKPSTAVPKASEFEMQAQTRYWVHKGQGGFEALDIQHPEPGLIRFEDPSLASIHTPIASQIQDLLSTRPGIRGIQHLHQEAALLIRHNPNRISAEQIVDQILSLLTREAPLLSVADPKRIPMAVSTTTVGLSTIGQLLIPAATPVAAGILIATNYQALRDAASHLTRGKVGVPLFHTALLTCSIVTGQVLAFALTDWSLKYWQRKWRSRLVQETETTLQETVPTLVQIRHVGEDGVERLGSPQSIRPGDRLRVLKGEMVPADGRIVDGFALVDETILKGIATPVRKQVSQDILAGSMILAGQIEFLVDRSGADVEIAKIGREIQRTATLIPVDPILNARIQKLGDNTALPVLATAGVGWAVGSLITVGAILHQDWVTGPYFAVPLITLQHLRECLALGVIMRHPSAMMRLAEAQFLLLDGDDPALTRKELKVKSLSPEMAQSNAMMQAIIGASLYLGDERSTSFLRMASEMGIAVKQPALVRMTPELIEASEGHHQILLHSLPKSGLRVEIDGKSVGEIHFEEALQPSARDLVRTAQQMGFDVFLLSSKDDLETGQLAQSLGIPLHGGDLDVDGKIRFLEGLKARGVKTLLAGSNACIQDLGAHAHVTVSIGDLAQCTGLSDFATQGHYFPAIADLISLSQRYLPEIRQNNRTALIPNLLCVAGAFGGLLNGITSGVIANIAVANVDRESRRKLKRHPIPRARMMAPRN